MGEQEILKVLETGSGDFESLAMELFRYQYRENEVYRAFVQAIGRDPGKVKQLTDIPFLPIRFFKTALVKTGRFDPEAIFESSGTTGLQNSRHAVKSLLVYERSFLNGFKRVYGDPGDYCILGLLPSYLERGHSSLVYMADRLIRKSGQPESGFYLHDYAALADQLKKLEKAGRSTLLIGVSFALLDFAEQFPMPLQHTLIMETGGMKGRRAELIRSELHALLKNAFSLPSIHSEYGMTELLSQAYSPGEGIYTSPPWMKILLRDEEDPLTLSLSGSGAVNIIDFANLYSCSFIATDDAGKVYPDGSFEILGRMDGSDLRGCSLLLGRGEL